MALESLRLIAILPVSPDRLYSAWLDPKEHASFTGDHATSDPGVGGQYTAWGGYISGRHVELEPGRRIVQVWRTTEFPADAEDSRLELLFEPVGDGTETKVTLIHTNIPEGQGAQYKSGWGEHYFEPMRAYFSETVESAPAPKKATAPKKAAKKKAAPKKAVKKAAAPKKAPKKAAKKAAKKARKKTAAPKKATAPKKAAKKSGKTAPKKKAAAPKKTAKNTAKKAKPRKSARR